MKTDLEDERYKICPYRSDLLVHPRDWYLEFGLKKPLYWTPVEKTKGVRVRHVLYPFYSPESGWEWVSINSHKYERMVERAENLDA